LFPIANLFCRGHRLRLDLSSSNFPYFDVNPNSGEPEDEWRLPRIAHNRVFVESARPSHILLPVIPLERSDRVWGENKADASWTPQVRARSHCF
jgi:predicted acyl esterase